MEEADGFVRIHATGGSIEAGMHIVNEKQLPFAGMSYEFVGAEQGGADASFFLVNSEPGRAVRLHRHDYDEIVYVIEGQSTWTVAGVEHRAAAGDVLVVKAGEPHGFVNSGPGLLRQIDIHLNPTFETVWLED